MFSINVLFLKTHTFLIRNKTKIILTVFLKLDRSVCLINENKIDADKDLN